jgi:hypothetical protein
MKNNKALICTCPDSPTIWDSKGIEAMMFIQMVHRVLRHPDINDIWKQESAMNYAITRLGQQWRLQIEPQSDQEEPSSETDKARR